jgi:nucleotide sugar dehydrogenase
MSVMKLAREDIDTPEKREKYTVSVVGCGRVGLSTACLFAEAGFKVIGVDTDQRIINSVKKGKSPFTEAQLDALIKKHSKEGRLTATTDARNAASASNIIIFTVPTPVDERKKPDYSHVEKACKEVGMGLRSGSLIIFQSTTGPGVTETLVKETLENASGLKAGVDFGLAYCPIHVTSGQVLEDMATSARVVGAINHQSLEATCLVLGTIVKGKIVKVRNIRTAEAVKLFENAYLDVNVALANELARFCEKTGIDFVEARNAANTQPHCHLPVPRIADGQISKDPYILTKEAEEVNVKLRMLTLARKTNDEMLDHTLHLARDALRSCGKTLRRAKISVFGISCRPNVKEPNGYSTKRLINMLRKKGAKVQVYDPFFSYRELLKMGYPAKRTLTKTVEGVDCIIIAVGHDRFKRLNLERIKVLVKNPTAIVDMGHVIEPDKAEKKGFVYRGVGRGIPAR